MHTELEEIEQLYAVKREEVYQRCFHSLRTRLKRLDKQREKMIKMLMAKNLQSAKDKQFTAKSTGVCPNDEQVQPQSDSPHDDVHGKTSLHSFVTPQLLLHHQKQQINSSPVELSRWLHIMMTWMLIHRCRSKPTMMELDTEKCNS